jgi:primosomal protein N' (replication factor Y)
MPQEEPPKPKNQSTAASAAAGAGTGDAHQQELFDTSPPPWEMLTESKASLASIVFADAPHGPYDYIVPDTLWSQVVPGARVHVPLGHRRQPMVGWCIDVKRDQPTSPKMRAVIETLDPEPLCDNHLVQLVMWISHYYQSPPGLVFDTLVPSGVRSAAGTREVNFFSITPAALDDAAVGALPAKQREVVRTILTSGHAWTLGQVMAKVECTEAPIRQLAKKGLLQIEKRRVFAADTANPVPLGEADGGAGQKITRLSPEQSEALTRITAALDSAKTATFVLHGVTGSGKTEVYIRAIEHVVKFGRGAIVLVPEISLTPQTRARFESRFRGVAVLHSQMTPTERHHQWQRIRAGGVQVVVGPRSAVFAPMPRLGLIVIDEEHDASFKQDTQPRYHARRVAHRRAALLGIPLVLGSATPSLESFHACKTGHAEMIKMDNRIANRPMPDVRLVDLRQREERGNGAISRPLVQAMHHTLKENGQVILLLNRRGFATQIQCPACGNVVACPDCDLPLTHHRDGSKAVCHYCDYTIPTPPICPACHFDGIRYGGLGTQRLETEIKARFPDATLARMDSDTMRKPGSHHRVLAAFRSGETKILLGTQMIAKGLDFPNVLLVGVINADSALHFPDFRAAERTFQLVTQVAGRTGRGDRGGQVIVQTFSPDHPAIIAASHHDYEQFAQHEMLQREKFHYPPLGNVARIIIRGESEKATESFADSLLTRLESAKLSLGAEVRILGPAPPPISKLRGKFRFHILLQSTDNRLLGQTIRIATKDYHPLAKEDIQYVIDIDPLDML